MDIISENGVNLSQDVSTNFSALDGVSLDDLPPNVRDAIEMGTFQMGISMFHESKTQTDEAFEEIDEIINS